MGNGRKGDVVKEEGAEDASNAGEGARRWREDVEGGERALLGVK
jgi:hypothetical protein